MDHLLYVSMTGASEIFTAQAAASHNLANTATTGFRADFNAFRAMPVFGPGYPTRVYAMGERPGNDFSPGVLQRTGRELDVAVQGEGWIAVQGRDGSEAYTRAGDLRVEASGLLVTAAGFPVLGNGGPITLPPASKIEMAADGTLNVLPVGQPANTMAAADRIRLVRPAEADLIKGDDGLFRHREGATAAPDANVTITSGALEGSNVNPVEMMVTMLDLARQYEMQVKMMRAAEQGEQAAAEVLKLT